MKKVILTVIIALVSVISNAQLIVKEAGKDTVIWQATKLASVPKIVKFTIDSADSYTIYYRNAKYSTITDVDYITTGDRETSIQFYELCKSVAETGKEYNIELDNKSLILSKGTMGTIMIWSEYSYFYLSAKQVTAILEKL